MKDVTVGQRVAGRVTATFESGIYVNFGAQRDGLMYAPDAWNVYRVDDTLESLRVQAIVHTKRGARVLLENDALNGYDSINVTKLDVLTGLPTIEIGARYLVDGVALPDSYMPASLAELAKVTVEYVTMPGWSEDLSQCTSYDELPANAQAYLRKMEELAGVPISWVGVGPDRKNMFLMPGLI